MDEAAARPLATIQRATARFENSTRRGSRDHRGTAPIGTVSMVYGLADSASGRGSPRPPAATSTSTASNAFTRHAGPWRSFGRLVVVSVPHRQRLAPARLHEPGGLVPRPGPRSATTPSPTSSAKRMRTPRRLPAAAAGDHRDLARQPSRHLVLLFLCGPLTLPLSRRGEVEWVPLPAEGERVG